MATTVSIHPIIVVELLLGNNTKMSMPVRLRHVSQSPEARQHVLRMLRKRGVYHTPSPVLVFGSRIRLFFIHTLPRVDGSSVA